MSIFPQQSINNEFETIDLIPRLMTEFGYLPHRAEAVADKLINANPTVKSAFWAWWQTGALDETLTVEGYTLQRLIRERAMKPVAAFLALDWLLRDPKMAKATIARGYDSVISSGQEKKAHPTELTYTRFVGATPQFNFAFVYPRDWPIRELHGSKCDEVFVLGPPNTTNTYHANLIVRVTPASEANGHVLTLNAFVADYLEWHERSRTFRVLSQTHGFFGEFAAAEIESSHVAPLPINTINATDTTVAERRVIIHRHDHFYEVIYGAAEEDYEKYLEAFKVAVRTLEFHSDTPQQASRPLIAPALAHAVHEPKSEYDVDNNAT